MFSGKNKKIDGSFLRIEGGNFDQSYYELRTAKEVEKCSN